MKVHIHVDSKGATAGLSDLARRQLPFMTARLLTALGGDVQAHFKRRLPVAFDRPTPFTQRGVFMKRADKATLTAEVFFPNSQEEHGRAQREYLQPGVNSATYARQQKKTEFLLTRMGVLPAGWVTVPGRYIQNGRLDGYGNMPGAYYKQIIRNLQIKSHALKPVTAASQRRAARMGVDNEFFAVTPGRNSLANGGGWLPPGVWKRQGKGGRTLLQYLKFVRKASYRQRFDVKAEAETAVRANLEPRWRSVVSDMATKFRAR